MQNPSLVFVLVSLRSLYNVGSIFRTADGLGVEKIYLTGFTGTPLQSKVQKTALGAEQTIAWQKVKSASSLIRHLRAEGYTIVALEKTETSHDFRAWKPNKKTAILLGNEERGISTRILTQADSIIHLPMLGTKESLNVAVAAGIIGYDWLAKMSQT